MPQFTVSKLIDAPVGIVFQIFIDLEKAPGRIDGMKKMEVLTPGPIGRGTRFRETRVIMKHEATEEMEITWFDPPRGYTLEGHSQGMAYTTTFKFDQKGESTLVTVEFRARAQSFVSKLMAPVGWVMIGAVRKCIESELKDFKTAAEREASPAILRSY